MIQEYQGQFNAEGMSFGIVVARFNELVTKNLLNGAVDCLLRHGADHENIKIAWVPGSFEIPVIAKHMAMSAQFDAVICLGAVIRGATDHYEYVAAQAASGIASTALETGTPVIFGLLTTDTLEQAIERSGSTAGNKGYDAAMAAIEMVSLTDDLFDDIYEDVIEEEIAESFAFDEDDQVEEEVEVAIEAPAPKNGKKIHK